MFRLNVQIVSDNEDLWSQPFTILILQMRV